MGSGAAPTAAASGSAGISDLRRRAAGPDLTGSAGRGCGGAAVGSHGAPCSLTPHRAAPLQRLKAAGGVRGNAAGNEGKAGTELSPPLCAPSPAKRAAQPPLLPVGRCGAFGSSSGGPTGGEWGGDGGDVRHRGGGAGRASVPSMLWGELRAASIVPTHRGRSEPSLPQFGSAPRCALGAFGAAPPNGPRGRPQPRGSVMCRYLPGTRRTNPERCLAKSGCDWSIRVSTETVHFLPCRLHCTGWATLTRSERFSLQSKAEQSKGTALSAAPERLRALRAAAPIPLRALFLPLLCVTHRPPSAGLQGALSAWRRWGGRSAVRVHRRGERSPPGAQLGKSGEVPRSARRTEAVWGPEVSHRAKRGRGDPRDHPTPTQPQPTAPTHGTWKRPQRKGGV